MPAKEAIYFTKQQIQRLIELYQGEENLWNISSTDYHKRDKKNDSLEKIKDILEEEFQGIQPFTGSFKVCYNADKIKEDLSEKDLRPVKILVHGRYLVTEDVINISKK